MGLGGVRVVDKRPKPLAIVSGGRLQSASTRQDSIPVSFRGLFQEA